MPPVFFQEVRCKRLLQRLPVSSLGCWWTANPYLGCQHPCAYCYARGSHRYVGYQGGEEFERRMVVKVNAAAVLREELGRPSWPGECIAIGTACDPYLPAELKYNVSRQLLGVLMEHGQPCCLTTKSTLLLRDLNLLKELAARALVQVQVRLCTLNEAVWRHVEPDASRPAKRLEALERLAEAGVPAGVLLAPILPDLTDAPENLESLARAAAAHGASFLGSNIPILRPGSREWTLPLLREQHPHIEPQYVRRYRGVYDPSSYASEVLARVAALREWFGLPESAPPRAPALRAGQLSLGI